MRVQARVLRARDGVRKAHSTNQDTQEANAAAKRVQARRAYKRRPTEGIAPLKAGSPAKRDDERDGVATRRNVGQRATTHTGGTKTKSGERCTNTL